MSKNSNNLCVFCKKRVTKRQEALACDLCQCWQHRKCNTGIKRSFYKKVIYNPELLEKFFCDDCKENVQVSNFIFANN